MSRLAGAEDAKWMSDERAKTAKGRWKSMVLKNECRTRHNQDHRTSIAACKGTGRTRLNQSTGVQEMMNVPTGMGNRSRVRNKEATRRSAAQAGGDGR